MIDRVVERADLVNESEFEGLLAGENAAARQPSSTRARDDSPDTFRIRIWWENGGETVVYDNEFGQSIGGGSIVIHIQ